MRLDLLRRRNLIRGANMIKSKSWKKADYPNAKPCWQKHKTKKNYINIVNVLNTLDWEKLAKIGKEGEND